MANLIALRDQENLVNASQTTAAAKPQNAGNRQLQPKTPGQRVPKTPFKVPLNDENVPHGAKTGLKPGAKGDENAVTAKKSALGGKSSLITPMGRLPLGVTLHCDTLADIEAVAPKTNRAPLGQKTTNAKATARPTPAAAPTEVPLAETKRASARARRATPKPAHTEPVPLDVLLDGPDPADDAIEYMPPRRAPLPDRPDDLPADRDSYYAAFADDRAIRAAAACALNADRDAAGRTRAEREREREARDRAREEREALARLRRDGAAMAGEWCAHEPECAGECCDRADVVQAAEDAFQQEMRAIAKDFDAPAELESAVPADPTDGPSQEQARQAAAALATPRPAPAPAAPRYAQPTRAAAAKSATATSAPAGRGGMTAGAAASRSTLGYAKGRAASASLRAMCDQGTTAAAGKPTDRVGRPQPARAGRSAGAAAGKPGLAPGSPLAWLALGKDDGKLERAMALDWEREDEWLREHAL